MRVLVTGGLGFIGSHVAERFHKEGHQIFIIDNLSSGNSDNLDIPYKLYSLNVESSKCVEVFNSHKFDVVIHLAAQINVAISLDNPYLDAKSNILGLNNMLNLSAKYGVKKFIFASSAAVYGMNEHTPLQEEAICNPLSPYGMNKWLGESYCKKFTELYGLDTLCFRFSNVYGPRQGTIGEGGVVSIYLERMFKNQDLIIYGDGNQTRDFIYVEDVADAIYRGVEAEYKDVLNLSTNTEKSVNELLEIFKGLHPIKGVVYRDARKGDIYRSSLDNTKVKHQLDWVPKYSLKEGLTKTYEWFAAQQQKPIKQSKEKTPSRFTSLRRFLPYIENLAAFGIVTALTIGTQSNIQTYQLDYKLIYILLISMFYGTRQSLISFALSSLLFLGMSLTNGRDLISFMYDTQSLATIAAYLFIGVVVGYTVDRKNGEIKTAKIQMVASEERNEFLNEIYKDTRLVKEELQNQIMNTEDSFGKIYNITKELDSLEPELIFNAAIGVLEQVMKSNSISIYTMNKYGNFLRLAAKSNITDIQLPKSMKVSEYPHLQYLVDNQSLYTNKVLDQDLPILSAPILDNGRVIAVISLHHLPFENFTLYYENLFKVAVELISSSLFKAHRYLDATQNERYIEGTEVLNEVAFLSILESKKQTKTKLNIDFILLMISNQDIQLEELSHMVSSSLRESDYIGRGMDGHYYILLSNSERQDAEIVATLYVVITSKKHTLSESITRLIILLLLPLAGALLLAFSAWARGRHSKEAFDPHMDENESPQIASLGIYKRIDMKKEMNIVPIEEALLLNDTTTKRRILIDALKNDSIQHLGILQKALENEDTETSHYAATAVMEIKRKLTLEKQKLSIKYEENKFDLETLIPYAKVLKSFIQSGLLDDRTLVKTKHTYSQVLESLLVVYPDEEIYFVEKINIDLAIGNVDKARVMCKTFHIAHPNSETPYIVSMQMHYTLKNNRLFQESLNDLKNSPIRLSNNALNIVRFWSGA
jgi:UDP-glucuronate decarboxylase